MLKHREDDQLFNLVLVETWNTCNRRCWFCKFGQPRAGEVRTRMSWQVIDKILEDLKYIHYSRRVSWVGINEPLLDGRLVEIVDKTRRALPNCFQSTITNGDRLTAELYRELTAAGLDSLAVSVYDDAALERISGLDLPGAHIWDRRPYGEPQQAVHTIDFTNRAGKLAVSAPQDDARDLPCFKTHSGIGVLPTGVVPLCSDDMYGDVVMGNVLERSLLDIWFGDAFTRYRNQLWRGRHGLEPCRSCTNRGGPHLVRFP